MMELARPTTEAPNQLEPGELPAWQLARRQRIIDAALELLEESDYDRIQIRDVSSRAGVAVGTLYRYFRSKEHLYAAVMVEWAKSFESNLQRRPLRGTPHERMKEVARRVIKAFEHRSQFLRLEMVLENSVDADALAVFREVGGRNLASFREALPGMPTPFSEQVLVIVTSVMSTYLRQYANGNISIEGVRSKVYGAIDCVFGPRPKGRS